MIRCVIVENEQKHIKHLSALLSKHFPEIDVLAICETVPDGVEKVKKLKPELLFLDVELSPYTGFDLLEQTPDIGYKVIFTTSYNKYAVKAIEFCALHYLVKPFGETELKRSIDRYKQSVQAVSQDNQLKSLLRNLKQKEIDELDVFIPVKNGEQKLRLGNIIFCAAEDGGTSFYLKGKEKLSVSKSLNWAAEMLSGYEFFRTHDSYLVNFSHVKKITHMREAAEVTMSDNYVAEVSRRKKAEFLEAVKKRNILKG